MLRNIPLQKVFYKILQLGCLLKSTIFVVQKAAAPKNGVEFCQKSIFVIRYFLATLYDDVRCRLKFSVTNKQTNKATYRGGAHLKIEKRYVKYGTPIGAKIIFSKCLLLKIPNQTNKGNYAKKLENCDKRDLGRGSKGKKGNWLSGE